jgi:hypothetical protein
MHYTWTIRSVHAFCNECCFPLASRLFSANLNGANVHRILCQPPQTEKCRSGHFCSAVHGINLHEALVRYLPGSREIFAVNKITVPRVEGRNAAIKSTVSPYTIISLFLNGIVNRKDWFCSVRSDLKSTVQRLATVPSRH